MSVHLLNTMRLGLALQVQAGTTIRFAWRPRLSAAVGDSGVTSFKVLKGSFPKVTHRPVTPATGAGRSQEPPRSPGGHSCLEGWLRPPQGSPASLLREVQNRHLGSCVLDKNCRFSEETREWDPFQETSQSKSSPRDHGPGSRRPPEQDSEVAAEATVAADLLQPALQYLHQLHLVWPASPTVCPEQTSPCGSGDSAADKVPPHAGRGGGCARAQSWQSCGGPRSPEGGAVGFPPKPQLRELPAKPARGGTHLDHASPGRTSAAEGDWLKLFRRFFPVR